MTFATFTNIIVILLCLAVLVQSVRLIRGFQAVKDGGLKETVASLENATSQARAVLADLKQTLRTDGAANTRAIAEGEAIRDELSVMVGIANAVAERIVGSVETKRQPASKTKAKPGAPAGKATPVAAAPVAKDGAAAKAVKSTPAKAAPPKPASVDKRPSKRAAQPAGAR